MPLILPDWLQAEVDTARAAVPSKQTARTAISCMDLTSLKGDETEYDTIVLCEKAKANHTFSVCIYPEHLSVARRSMRETGQDIATVINFPHGDRRTLNDEPATPETTAQDTAKAIAAGATQIDIVLPYESFQKGNDDYARSLLEACRTACGQTRIMTILETATFDSADQLREACRMAIDCGTDFLKTSTGKHAKGGATLETAAILLNEAANAPRPVGVKIAGGATVDNHAGFVALASSFLGGADKIKPENFRIGASSLLDGLNKILEAGHDPNAINPNYQHVHYY
jgi:deoxyribose-phosphate aldolase